MMFKIVSAEKYGNLKKNRIVRTFSANVKNVFLAAKKYCVENNVPYDTYFPVLAVSGECAYILHYTENKIYTVVMPKGITVKLFFEYNAEINMENLDYSLVERANAYIFSELEEYTYILARLLAIKYPYKSIFFCDEKISYFPELSDQVKYISLSCGYEIFDKEQCLWVSSDGKNTQAMNTYNSINVINSIFWCYKRECFGEKNKDSHILVVDFEGGNAGLVDYIKFTYFYYLIAKQRNWKFAIDLSRQPNQYLRSESENMWDYFFESLSDISLKEVYESASVIRLSNNGIEIRDFATIPYVRDGFQIDGIEVMNAVKFNENTRKRIDELMPDVLKHDNHVLGVILRGTDYREEANRIIGRNSHPANLEKMIIKCKSIMDCYGYSYIFVATEDGEYFAKMKEEFGDKCLYIEQKRAYHDYRTQYKSCAELLNVENGQDFGMRYLAVIQSLANCKGLLANMNNGTTFAARGLNNLKYEYYEVLHS